MYRGEEWWAGRFSPCLSLLNQAMSQLFSASEWKCMSTCLMSDGYSYSLIHKNTAGLTLKENIAVSVFEKLMVLLFIGGIF